MIEVSSNKKVYEVLVGAGDHVAEGAYHQLVTG